MTQEDLVVWLRAQLAEDEQAVRALDPPPAIPWMGPRTQQLERALFDRMRTQLLADATAKRRILDAYEEAVRFYDAPVNRHIPAGEVTGLRTAVTLLAPPYAGRSGFREVWESWS